MTAKIKKLISNKTKIIAITHISNVTGVVIPIKKIVDIAKEKNPTTLLVGLNEARFLLKQNKAHEALIVARQIYETFKDVMTVRLQSEE